MGDEEEGGGKKEPLIVEGVDVNSLSHSALLRHVSTMVEDLLMERAERGRAMAEADFARTAWENAERELERAEKRLMCVRLEAEKAERREPKPKSYILPPDTAIRKERLADKVKEMVDQLPKGLDKRVKLPDKFQVTPLLEDAGKEVVEAIDRHIAFAEENLQRVCNSQTSLRIRERYLRTFYQVQLAQIESEKDTLIRNVSLLQEQNFKKVEDFFKKIVQNDIFLMLGLKERITSLKALKNKRIKAVSDAQNGLLALKNDMKTLLAQIDKGKRKAKLYESNKSLLANYEQMIKKKERELEALCMKKMELDKELGATQDYKAMYIEIMENMKKERCAMLERFNEADVFTSYSEYFAELMQALEKAEEMERADPGRLAGLRKALSEERKAVEDLKRKIAEQDRMTYELIVAAENKFSEIGLQPRTNFQGTKAVQ